LKYSILGKVHAGAIYFLGCLYNVLSEYGGVLAKLQHFIIEADNE